MRHGLILMFMLSLLGHIAAAGMLYIAGAYGVWDKHPRDGMDDQRGDAVRVLWGFAEETPMSLRGTKGHGNPPPLKGGGEGEGEQRVLAPLPLVPSHEGRGNKERVFSDETLVSPRLTKEHENVIPAEAGIQDEGRGLDSHVRGNDGQLEGFSDEPSMSPRLTKDDENTLPFKGRDRVGMGVFSDESGGNPDSSAPSMASMGTSGDCSRSATCMGADTAISEVYPRPSPGIDEAGSHGRGGQGKGLKTFLEALRVEIERHKNYPPFARKNGIEGTAYLNFHIGDNGIPDGIIIEKSSGSKILDESAIRTLKSMERFYPVPVEIRELEITVPIAYRLVEDTEKVNR